MGFTETHTHTHNTTLTLVSGRAINTWQCPNILTNVVPTTHIQNNHTQTPIDFFFPTYTVGLKEAQTHTYTRTQTYLSIKVSGKGIHTWHHPNKFTNVSNNTKLHNKDTRTQAFFYKHPHRVIHTHTHTFTHTALTLGL